MKYCVHCGHQIPDEAQSCPFCNRPVFQQPAVQPPYTGNTSYPSGSPPVPPFPQNSYYPGQGQQPPFPPPPPNKKSKAPIILAIVSFILVLLLLGIFLAFRLFSDIKTQLVAIRQYQEEIASAPYSENYGTSSGPTSEAVYSQAPSEAAPSEIFSQDVLVGEWDGGDGGYLIMKADGTVEWYSDKSRDPNNVFRGSYTVTSTMVDITTGEPANGFFVDIAFTEITINGENTISEVTVAPFEFYPSSRNSMRVENIKAATHTDFVRVA